MGFCGLSIANIEELKAIEMTKREKRDSRRKAVNERELTTVKRPRKAEEERDDRRHSSNR